MYYPDLSTYVYMGAHPGWINIGWLAIGKPYNKGVVPPATLAKIGELCTRPSNRTRGAHDCPWCPGVHVREDVLGDGVERLLGTAEIHVSGGGIYWMYVAPTLMIYHYILRHGYLPPREFLDAVERFADVATPWVGRELE
jgi:hypothetical protein